MGKKVQTSDIELFGSQLICIKHYKTWLVYVVGYIGPNSNICRPETFFTVSQASNFASFLANWGAHQPVSNGRQKPCGLPPTYRHSPLTGMFPLLGGPPKVAGAYQVCCPPWSETSQQVWGQTSVGSASVSFNPVSQTPSQSSQGTANCVWIIIWCDFDKGSRQISPSHFKTVNLEIVGRTKYPT